MYANIRKKNADTVNGLASNIPVLFYPIHRVAAVQMSILLEYSGKQSEWRRETLRQYLPMPPKVNAHHELAVNRLCHVARLCCEIRQWQGQLLCYTEANMVSFPWRKEKMANYLLCQFSTSMEFFTAQNIINWHHPPTHPQSEMVQSILPPSGFSCFVYELIMQPNLSQYLAALPNSLLGHQIPSLSVGSPSLELSQRVTAVMPSLQRM